MSQYQSVVDECMQPHLETIQHNKDALILQEIQNKNQNDQISSMKNSIGGGRFTDQG
jgi:hypothetical protein